MAWKILIVDDEPHILRLLASRLRANHYDVIAASDAARGFRAASEELPDLILLDIRMPGKDGVSLFNNLKESDLTADIPVIFITAYPQKNVRENVLVLGAVDFIAKPFNAEDLLKKVEKAMTAPRPAKNMKNRSGPKPVPLTGKTADERSKAKEALSPPEPDHLKENLANTSRPEDEDVELL